MKRPRWTPEQDNILIKAVRKGKAGTWKKISALIDGKSERSCRTRWHNELSKKFEKRYFTQAEDNFIKLGRELRTPLIDISKMLYRINDNMVKNRYHWLRRQNDEPATEISERPEIVSDPDFNLPRLKFSDLYTPIFPEKSDDIQSTMMESAMSQPILAPSAQLTSTPPRPSVESCSCVDEIMKSVLHGLAERGLKVEEMRK